MRIIGMIFISSMLFMLSGCWYTKQAYFFLEDRIKAADLEALARDKDASEDLRLLQERISRIRRFAAEELGLKLTKSYRKYRALERDYVALVVSACDSDSFTRYYWRYPFLGKLPYKGFYVEKDAEKEFSRLKSLGYDTVLRKVEAFSSLGFFNDPLFSFMKDYSESELAELVFHESAHATLWVKKDDQFNEEYATFLGREAAVRYLKHVYGPGSEELKDFRERLEDRRLFAEYLKETARLLEDLYSDTDLSREEKLAGKQAIIEKRAEEYSVWAPANLYSESRAGFDMTRINNAYLDLFRLYEEDLSLYEQWYTEKAESDLRIFTESLVELAKKAGPGIKEKMMLALEGLKDQ